jgi:hypothetical protein
MKWTSTRGAYACDLGLGGKQYPVGTATQIWGSVSTLVAAQLNEAKAAASKRAGQSPPAAATPSGLQAVKDSLRRQMELADQNWQSWTPN